MSKDKQMEAQRLIAREVAKGIDLLHKHLAKYCVDNNTKEVPIAYINSSVSVILGSYQKEVNKTNR